jgi:hypothetical protein
MSSRSSALPASQFLHTKTRKMIEAHRKFSAFVPKKGEAITCHKRGVVIGIVHRVERNKCWIAYSDGHEPLPFPWCIEARTIFGSDISVHQPAHVNNFYSWPNKEGKQMSENQFYGWYDDKTQPVDKPTYDPPHNGPCLMCGNSITADDVRTHSLMRLGTYATRSYFFRTHRTCSEKSGEHDVIDGVVFRMIERNGD